MDIGGSWLRWSISEGVEGRIPSRGLELLPFMESFIKKYEVGILGISFAGQVEDGKIVASPNVEMPPIDIRKYLHGKTGVELRIENDLNCAALAEAEEWKSDHLAALYSGTGLGAGVVAEGRLLRGSRDMAGEIGHVPYRDAPFACGCGKRNCLELYASGSGLEKWCRHLGCGERTLDAMRRSSQASCRRIAENYLKALLSAAGTLITLCNPEILVLGGGVIGANPWLLDRVREEIAEYALPAALPKTRIELSPLENASLRGAEILAGYILSGEHREKSGF